jgi:rsbT co-antagonist protein RsbR
MHWLQKTLTPQVADESLRRQGFLVVIVSSALTALALVLSLSSLGAPNQSPITIGIAFFGSFLYLSCAIMARYGIIRPAAYLITWGPCVGIIATLIANPSAIAIAFFSLPILLASIVLSSRQMLPIALLELFVALIIARQSAAEDRSYYAVIFFVIMISALAYLGAWSVERALRAAGVAGRDLELANRALLASNGDLEGRVAQRTADLQQTLHSLQGREAELHQTLDDLRSSQDTIRELSAPILPVAPGVLVAPMVGALDSARAAVLTSSLLSAAERASARYMIMDVTGVPVIDTQVAQVLLQAAQALRLLGTRVIITGIRPEVAQTLVGLGADLGEVITRGSLQSGIAEAIRRLSPAVLV